MDFWLIASIGLAALALVLLTLWLRERRRTRVSSAHDLYRINLELTLAEQQGRLGIVRELQDIAVLSVSRLITGAEAARFTAERDPASAVRAASGLVDDGRAALADLRRVLTVVREGEAVSTSQPGLHSAHDLFRVMRDAGLLVRFTETGERFALTPGAEVAILRILQVALTNSLKHGGTGTEVSLSIGWTTDGMQLQIDDDGIRAAARRQSSDADEVATRTRYTVDDDLKAFSENLSGSGMTQIRERAGLFGGVLNAGTVPGVGFSVSVVFPSLRYHNGVHGVNLSR